MSVSYLVDIARATRHVSGLPAAGDALGGNPSPLTALGVYLGIKAAIRETLGTDSARGVRVAVQGVGSVGEGVARRLADEGAKLTLADVDLTRAKALRSEEHTSELQSLMRITYAVFCLKKKNLHSLITTH